MTTRLASATEREVASQPEVWTRALGEAAAARDVLPAAGEPVLVLGCGTSYYIGESYARLRLAAGQGRTRAAIASELDWVDDDETLLLISRSGTTADLVRAVQDCRGGRRVVGILGGRATPVAQLCDGVVDLGFADEDSVVQTRFATSVLVLLRACLGEDLRHLPGQARAALAEPVPGALPAQIVFLGRGWTVGLAAEAALKCREAAGAWAEAYPAREYPHGPVSAAGPTSLVWSFDPLPDFVRSALAATGAAVVEPRLDPLAQLVAVHRLALALADAAGRNPDAPPHLSRSVQVC